MKKTKEGIKKRIDTFEVIKRRSGQDPKTREYCDRAIRKLRKEGQREA